MASTNKTTNYELSQYIGTDKPTYLSDYNGDMQKIDAQMKVNADNVATAISSASTATSTANTASSTASSALSTAQSANTTAGQANTTATNAQSTANSALSTATTAQTTANSALTNIEKFNLSNFDTIATTDFTITSGTVGSSNLTVATNSDGSVAKIYGQVDINGASSGTASFSTDLRPETNLTINGGCTAVFKNASSVVITIASISLTVSTTGTVTFDSLGLGGQSRYIFNNSLLLLKDFGDTPIQQ